MNRPRIHLARCDYCGRKIAWSRKRRQWLALAPVTDVRTSQLQRRMRCLESPNASYHDPRANLLDQTMRRIFGGAR